MYGLFLVRIRHKTRKLKVDHKWDITTNKQKRLLNIFLQPIRFHFTMVQQLATGTYRAVKKLKTLYWSRDKLALLK